MRPYTRHDVAVWTIQKRGTGEQLDMTMRDGSTHSVDITADDRAQFWLECQLTQLALDRINALRNATPTANAQDQCAEPTHDHRAALRIQVYKGRDGWRWRMVAANGRKVATSGEAFASEANADRAADRLIGATIVKG